MNTRPTVLEVNLSNFKHNIKEIKKAIGSQELMPIIKANGYGTYINRYLPAIKDFNIVGVANVDEAKELRELGFKNEIFVLNQPAIEELDKIVKYNITIGISSLEFIKEVVRRNLPITVHLEIETGMERTGVFIDDLPNYLKILQRGTNIKIEGIYTHLSSADTDKNYTIKQLNIFNQAVRYVKERINIKYIHSLASTGITNYFSNETNLVRPGIIIYGLNSTKSQSLKLKPICKLKTKIIYLKEVPKGTAIGYSKTYITNKRTKVATIPIGYADGLKRALSNKGYVVIKNKKCKIIGNICMDSCMIDVTNIKNIREGDEVYIWDNKIITVEEIAEICNTISYEIISTIGERVPRIFY